MAKLWTYTPGPDVRLAPNKVAPAVRQVLPSRPSSCVQACHGAAAEGEEYDMEAEEDPPLSESESEPDEESVDEVDSQGNPVTLKESIGSDNTPVITSARGDDSSVSRHAAVGRASSEFRTETAARGDGDSASHRAAVGPPQRNRRSTCSWR